MNSLIGLGAATSFTAGTASLLLPGAGLEVGFLEEPVMLLAFVLLGRALEARARLKASGQQPFFLFLYLCMCNSTTGRCRREQTTPCGVSLTRSVVSCQAAQTGRCTLRQPGPSHVYE